MHSIYSYPLTAALLLAVGALVGAEVPGRDPSGPPDPVARSLDDQLAHKTEVFKYKDYLLAAVLAGRMSLQDVADEYLRLDEEDPVVLELTIRNYPGESAREKSARHVLDAVRDRLPAGDVKGRAALDRLRTEFAATSGSSRSAGPPSPQQSDDLGRLRTVRRSSRSRPISS